MSNTTQPSEAAIREAKRRVSFGDNAFYTPTLLLAAQLIQKYEPDTLVDPALKRAREIYCEENQFVNHDNIRSGMYDNSPYIRSIVRALKEGTGS